MTKEMQLEFNFAKEQNLLEHKTCSTCMSFDYKKSMCLKDSASVSGSHSCGYYEYDAQKAMGEIATEARKEFHEILDKYKVPEHERHSIYSACNWF